MNRRALGARSVLIVQLIQFADPDALALVESFGKAVYAAPG